MPKWKQNKGKQEPENKLVFKRRFRCTFELLNIKQESVKRIELPIATIHKGIKKWQNMVVEYYDICAKGYEGLWEYILQDKFEVASGILKYYDGTGNCIQSLEICLKPNQIEISNPDYSTTKESTVKIYFDVLSLHLQRTTDEGKIPKSKSRR
jgi:hypothetical protein